MLLGMQGLFAEYERTKIMERTRRGKLHRAQLGALVGGHAPVGYRWVPRGDTDRARLEVVEHRAAAVRQMYAWLVEEKLSTWAIAKRLTDLGVPTAKGGGRWQPTGVFRILTNPAYKGSYRYRHTPDQHVSIPVPAIIPESVWEAAQQQLAENSQYSRRNNTRHNYLLRGLIRCPRCGGRYTGYVQHGSRGYRCNRANWASSSTGQRCAPGAIPAQPVEDAVWDAVKSALQRPELLVEEYRRRLTDVGATTDFEFERKQAALALKRVKAREDRVTDAYINEAVDLERYKAEMEKLREERIGLERLAQDVDRRERQQQDSRGAIDHLERFCSQVAQGLEAMTFEERQQLLRLVVEAITVENGLVRVETVIPTGHDQDQLRYVRDELVEP